MRAISGELKSWKQLQKIAPVYAVRGNNDKGAWAAAIPLYEALDLEGVSIHVLHDLKEIDLDPKAAGFDVVVSGHSHKPTVDERDGVTFVNPGSAGPRRFKLPVTVGYLDITTGRCLAAQPARASQPAAARARIARYCERVSDTRRRRWLRLLPPEKAGVDSGRDCRNPRNTHSDHPPTAVPPSGRGWSCP